jgi:iron-sulfur cluster assembly protein
MVITFTESAAKHIRTSSCSAAGSRPAGGIKKVWLLGFPPTRDFAEELRAGDSAFEAHDATVVVAADSLPYLDGARLDFVKDGLKQMFSLENPNVDNTCGCGESFSLKETSQA